MSGVGVTVGNPKPYIADQVRTLARPSSQQVGLFFLLAGVGFGRRPFCWLGVCVRRLPFCRLNLSGTLRSIHSQFTEPAMSNDPRFNRNKAILAWVGMAGVIAVMWWFFAE
jgi:hypothetical protein